MRTSKKRQVMNAQRKAQEQKRSAESKVTKENSWEGAKVLFVIFLVLAVLSYLGGTYYQRRQY